MLNLALTFYFCTSQACVLALPNSIQIYMKFMLTYGFNLQKIHTILISLACQKSLKRTLSAVNLPLLARTSGLLKFEIMSES